MVKSAREDKLILPLNAAPPLHHCALNFVPLNVVGNAKIHMYTWIMILEA